MTVDNFSGERGGKLFGVLFGRRGGGRTGGGGGIKWAARGLNAKSPY